MVLDKDTVGPIESLEVVELQGSTCLPKGPNGENVKLNQSEMNDDDELEVDGEYSFFIYPNRSGELFAAQNMPDITEDKYDFAKALKTGRDGARIDVGLPREVLVPWEDLPRVKSLWPQPGDHLLVILWIDRENHMYGRLANESVVEDIFTPVRDDNLKNEVIEARPYRTLQIGSLLLSESGCEIFVHEPERKAEPRLGESVQARIIGYDNKGELNGSFLPLTCGRLDDDGQVIFNLLVEYDGELPFWNKSNPEAIKEVFNMSKSSFKHTIGHLYKQKIIDIETGKITLTKKGWSWIEPKE